MTGIKGMISNISNRDNSNLKGNLRISNQNNNVSPKENLKAARKSMESRM